MRKEFAQNWHTITYEYNRFQNRSQMVKIDDVTGAKVTTKYSYHDNNWLLTEVETDGTRSSTKEYFYDHNGNLCRWEKSILKPKQSDVRGKLCFAPDGEEALLELRNYNAFGQLVWVYRDGEETHYSYRADGLRHHKITPNGEIIHHWDGQNIVMETLGHTVRARYLRGSSLVAQEIDNLRWYYLHNAHGDVTQRIQENGTAAPEYDYDSFGNTRNPAPNDPNPFRYCGEYFDAETNSYYLRNRNYEPGTGRFTSEDTHWNPSNMIYGDEPQKINVLKNEAGEESSYTLVPSIEAIRQSGNLYPYCMNNPVMWTDYTGKIVWLTAAAGGLVGGIVGGGANAIAQGLTKGWGNISWGEVGVSTVAGAASGALVGSGAGIVLVVAGNASIGAGAYAGIQTVNKEDITAIGVLVNAGIGALFGGIGGSSAQTVTRLTTLHRAIQSTSGLAKEWNKMLFSKLFWKEIGTSLGQGIRDEIAQLILDELLSQSEFSY